MGAFGGLILTNKGRNLQVKAQTGTQLNFTKVKIGDGELSGQSILELNDLISIKKELSILEIKTLPDGKASLKGYLSNADIVTGFYWRELGIFALDPDEGEILYCYGNAGSNAEYIPAGGGADVVEKYVNFVTIVDNASNVSATLGSEVYVTQADFNSHLSELRQTFNIPRINLVDGDSLVLFRGTIPADKVLKVLSAGISKDDGGTELNLIIELYNNTDGQSLYSTSQGVVQGSPLYDGSNTSGDDVEIRIKNATGASINCQGFMQVVIA